MRTRWRPALLTGLLLITVGIGWIYLAPTTVGGQATYVVTSGVSMEPRFHSGDLAIVRPAARYRVGEVAAYRSSLLHVVVLHRIIAIHGGRYTFKGDNNNFIDPAPPARAAIIGALWWHVPGGGRYLAWLHSPVTAAALAAGAILLLLGFGETSRRRGRRRRAGGRPQRPEGPAVADRGAARPLDVRSLLIVAAIGTVGLLAVAAFAFLRPTARAATQKVKYTQQVRFGYSAAAPAGPVYPAGLVRTGEPIFTQLVHRLGVDIDYRLSTDAPHAVQGTERVLLRLTGPTGWSRTLELVPSRHFTGDRVAAHVTLDLRAITALLGQVQRLTGVTGGGYAITVVPVLAVHGTVAGQPISGGFSPALPFELQGPQLQVGAGAAGAGGAGAGGTGGTGTSAPATSGLRPSQPGQVTTASTVPATVGFGSASLTIATLRIAAGIGFLLGLAATLLLGVLTIRGQAFAESVRIQARYGHLIVPITAGADLGWPAIDVTSIKALVRLAGRSGQLILHNHDTEADTYLVNDEGTVYRYQVKLPRVVWGEWSAPSAGPVTGPAAEPAGAAETG